MRNRIFGKGYRFLFFAENMGKNVGKNIGNKCCQKLLDDAEQLDTDAFKTTSKRTIQKTSEATSGLIGNKIPEKITKLSKYLR